MAAIPYLVAYLGIGVFLIAVLVRFAFWLKMPDHMRWELYPVAHEGKKASYGGSYYEDVKWWEKKRHASLYYEAKAMFIEIVFLAALFEHNRKLWYRSFPFHFGLYLIIAATAAMVFGALLGLVWPAALASWFGTLLQWAIVAMGFGGLGLGLLGSLGLLHRRLTDPELVDFTSASDLFNLAIFVVTLGVGLLTFVWVDRDFARVSFLMNNLVTFQFGALPGTAVEVILPVLSVVLFSFTLAYIPMTHMSHFVGKYFAYHAIRWNDKPNMRGSKEEATIQGLLTLPVSWSAEHIQGDGKKSWAEVATDESLWQKKAQ